MQGSPQRPFVPRLTPAKGQLAVGSSEFSISRPFIPGADRARVVSLGQEYQANPATEENALLPSIEAFLDHSAPASPTRVVATPENEFAADFAPEADELPPVEHFVDPLPSVDDYGAEVSDDAQRNDSFGFADTAASASAGSEGREWAETDWQQFDWRSAARLGETGDTEATNAWAATDWDASAPQPRERRPTAAQALATALDEIARRIRDGEVALPISGMASDPGSIAASLAALLGINR